MSSNQEQKAEAPAYQQLPSLWFLEIFIGDHPIVLVEQGFNAKHARARMIKSFKHDSYDEYLFPYALQTVKTFKAPAKNAIYVWDGTFVNNRNAKHYTEYPTVFEALCNGYIVQVTRHSTLFISGCSE